MNINVGVSSCLRALAFPKLGMMAYVGQVETDRGKCGTDRGKCGGATIMGTPLAPRVALSIPLTVAWNGVEIVGFPPRNALCPDLEGEYTVRMREPEEMVAE